MTQTTPTSCVYDAFKAAGLSTDGLSLDGISFGDIKEICKQRGLKYVERGRWTPKGAFILCVQNNETNTGHAEYYPRIPKNGLRFDNALLILL